MSENIDIATGAIDAKPPIISYGDDRDHESKNRDAGDLVGIEAELADAGLRSADIELGDDGIARVVGKDDPEADIESAAEALAARRMIEAEERPAREITLQDNGEDAEPDIALKSPEQAADVLAKMRENDALVAEMAETDQALAEYDLNEPPTTLTQEAQNPLDANAQQEQQPPVSQHDTPVQSEQLPPDEQPEAQLAHALRTNPAVRQAMIESINYGHQVAVQAKHAELVAAIRTVPEFANVPIEQIGAVDQYIRSVNPQRAAQIDAHLGRIACDVAAVNRAADQQRAQLQHQQAERDWYATNDRMREVPQAFERSHNMSPADNRALGEYMSDEMGLDARDPFVRQLLTQPAFYETALKAYKYDQLQKAGLPRPAPKPAPQVTRPGVGRGAAATRSEASLQSLNAKLNNSGSINDAMALLAARRRG